MPLASEAMKQQEKAGPSAPIVIAMIIGIVSVAMFMLLLMIGGTLFYVRPAQFENRTAQVAELKAIAEVQQAQAEVARAAARPTALTNDASFDFSIALDSEGRLTLDDMELTRDGLRELLLSRKQLDSTLTVRIKASANCAVKDLTPVLEICDSIDDVRYIITSETEE